MATFDTPNADFATRVCDSFARQPFMEYVGAVLEKVNPGEVDVFLPHRPQLTQQHGFFHGGVIATIADNAGAYAAFTLAPASASILTVEFKVSLLSPGSGDGLVARGRVIKPGRSLVVSRTDVLVRSVDGEKLIATALVTLMFLEGRDDMPTREALKGVAK